MARSRYWTCTRVTAGERCGKQNVNRAKVCHWCSKPRPKKRKPAHMKALEQDYAAFLALNGGVEACALCGATPKTRKLQRDHCHRSGVGRGLLCSRCNRALPSWITPAWLRKAAAYVERTHG
jgi:hypothetical protein